MKLTAQKIAQLSGGSVTSELGEKVVSGVAFHAERCREGYAFFALPGASAHGLDYADAALANGAAFIVSDRAHPNGIQVKDPKETLLELGRHVRKKRSGSVIGVTGSAGKTSTKTFSAAALNAQKSPGNFNTPLALAATLINTELAGYGHEPLVLELGIDHIGEMATLVDLVRPDYGVLTSVAPSHLEGLKNLETVAFEKSQLLSAATQLAFVSLQALPFLKDNADIDVAALRAKGLKTYGLEPEADIAGQLLGKTLSYKTVTVALSAPGEAMANNALVALALAQTLELDLEAAAERIEEAPNEPGRLHLQKLGELSVLDDSYNSNPASAHEALAILRTLPGPRTAVLGDMLELGPQSEHYHSELGLATQDFERVIAIGAAAKAIAEANPKARYFTSTDMALPALQHLPRQGSILFKASRGMKFETLVEELRRSQSSTSTSSTEDDSLR